MVAKFLNDWFGVYFQRRLIVIALLGFSCGVPYFLTSSTLTFWLTSLGYDRPTVSLFNLATLPAALVFLWAPFIDRMKIPFLSSFFGRRRAWLLFSQIGLIASLCSVYFIGPEFWLMLTIAFFAASQNTVFLAFQMETLPKSSYGPGEGIGIMGARLGMLLGYYGAPRLSDYITWELAYLSMALFILIGVVTTLWVQEPKPVINEETIEQEKKVSEYLHNHPSLNKQVATALSWIYASIICPFADFMSRKGWIAALCIMFFYKFGDNIIGTMANRMYIELGYTLAETTDATKLFGMITSLLGGLIGGVLITRMGFLRSLVYFGIIHMLATFMYIVNFYSGHDIPVLYMSVALEHFTAGMRTGALFSYQLTLSNPVYAATQLALLTSLVNLGRTTFSSFSGHLVDAVGWANFYGIAILASIPALMICVYLMKLNKEPLFRKPALQIS